MACLRNIGYDNRCLIMFGRGNGHTTIVICKFCFACYNVLDLVEIDHIFEMHYSKNTHKEHCSILENK
jgi:hypothetical protein